VTKTLARSGSVVTVSTWASTSAARRSMGSAAEASWRAASAPRSNDVAVEPTIDQRTSSLDATWAYRLAPWMSSALAMSRTLVAA
jgi:hypothetical protein